MDKFELVNCEYLNVFNGISNVVKGLVHVKTGPMQFQQKSLGFADCRMHIDAGKEAFLAVKE